MSAMLTARKFDREHGGKVSPFVELRLRSSSGSDVFVQFTPETMQRVCESITSLKLGESVSWADTIVLDDSLNHRNQVESATYDSYADAVLRPGLNSTGKIS